MTKNKKKFKKKLRFLRCLDYTLIPKEYILQLAGTDWSPEKFCKYQEALKNDPNNLLFGLVDANDEEQKLHGFLWAYADPMKESFVIYAYSVRRDYQNREMIPFARRFMEMLLRKTKLKNIYWYTDRPKAYESYGLHKSKYHLMCLYKE
jgi:hypothetical protein